MSDSKPDFRFVAQIRDAGTLLGTGILVHPEYIVTCEHVVRAGTGSVDGRHYEVVFPKKDGGLRTVGGAVQRLAAGSDLAVIQLDEPVNYGPAVFLIDLQSDLRTTLERTSFCAAGYTKLDPDFGLQLTHISGQLHFSENFETGTLMGVQATGGLMEGYSGGPLLTGPPWVCLGIAYQGGERAAVSRVILADSIVGLLEQHNVSVSATRAAEYLRVPHEKVPVSPTRLASRSSRRAPIAVSQPKKRVTGWVAGGVAVAALLGAGIVATRMYHPSTQSLLTDPGSRSNIVDPQPKKQAPPPPKTNNVQIVVYSGSERPKFTVNGKERRPEQYESGIATFKLASGDYDVKADYGERICEASISVTKDTQAGADCHLK